MTTSPEQITRLLDEWGKGNQAALDQLMPLVYADLRRMAKRYMNQQNPAHTLQATALVHEAYVRLTGNADKHWENSAHFFGVAAKAMRHVLVDHARANQSAKRGGAIKAVQLDEGAVASGEQMADIIALDDALTDLAKLHSRQGQIVELRFFGGLSVEETAESIGVSPETVMRYWRAAKAWLYGALNQSRTANDKGTDSHANDE